MSVYTQREMCQRTLFSIAIGALFLAVVPQALPASSVSCWGRDYYGQFNVPPGLNDAVAVSAGYQHCVALRSDGSVAVWGQNGDGQLNVATAVSNNVVAVRAGWYHTLAQLQDGSVAGWGAGLTNALTGHNYGQCLVPPNVTNVLDLAAGRYFSMALLSDRTVAVWGENLYGQTNVPAGLTNVSAIAAGGMHCMALKNNGTVVAWGGNGSGECNVPASLSNVVAIAAGYYNSYALQANGSVIIWGDNTEQQNIVPAGVSNVVLATGGAYYSMVVQDSGQPVAWDYDSFLGKVLAEAIVPSGLTNVTGIAAGFYMGLAVTNDGTPLITYQPAHRSVFSGNDLAFRALVAGAPPMAYQWFFNGEPIPNATNAALVLPAVQTNQAGLYSFVASNSLGSVSSSNALLTVLQQPPLLTAQPASVVTYRYGPASFMSAAIGSQPLSFQWQLNGTNLDGATNALLTYAHVVAQQPGNYSVVVSNQFGVATSTNAYLTILAVLDAGNANYSHYTVPNSLTDAVAIAAGNFHSLALKADHTLVTWGGNTTHVLDVPATATNIMAIAAGGNNSLVLRSNGTVVEWGDNYNGQTNVPANLSNVVAVAVGDNHAVALRSNGTVVAWGNNYYGQTNVPASATNIIAVAAGGWHCLALRSNGTLLAWGNNSNGQTNIPSGLGNVIAISAAYNHNFVLRSDGSVAGWGDTSGYFPGNDIVAVGTGNYSGANYFSVLRANGTVTGGYVYGASNATAIACGAAHNLVLLGDGAPCLYWPPKPWPATAVAPGDTVSTRVLVSGNGPLSYQWQLNGTNLLDATSATLTLTNLPLTSAGVYHCIISNAVGTIITSDITLNVKRVRPLLVSAGSGTASLSAHGFKLQVSGLAGQGALVVYGSTNLTDWFPIQTNPPVVGTLEVVDPGATNQEHFFYKAVEGP